MSNSLLDEDLEENDLEEESFKVSDRWDGFSPGPLPIAPDGGIEPGAFQGMEPTPIPPATPETFICLRGPCKHYLELKSFADVEGPRSDVPRMYIHRVCIVNPGKEIESTDTVIYNCNHWDPIPVWTLLRRKLLRGQYSLANLLKTRVW